MSSPTAQRPPRPAENRPSPYERAVVDKLDAVCRGIDGLGRGLRWAVIFLALTAVVTLIEFLTRR